MYKAPRSTGVKESISFRGGLFLIAILGLGLAGCAGRVSGNAAKGSGGTPSSLTISNPQATGATTTGFQVSWATNVSATSQVMYGTTASYGSSTPLNSSLVTTHQVTLSNLAAGTTYHFQIQSTDGSGASATSNDMTFATSANPGSLNVSITSPASGATVSGTVTVSASASSTIGVASVQFQLDGTNLGSLDTTTPYSVSWNTTSTSNGSHTLTAVAKDTASNSATSPGVTVTANNGPAGVSVTINPLIVDLAKGATQQFTATVTGSSDTAVTWAATTGSVNSMGLYTAPTSTITATVTATSVADITKSASAQVLVGGAGTQLARAAAALTPGVWTEFTAAENSSWNGGAFLDLGSGYTSTDSAVTWSDRGLWDPNGKAFYFWGGGHCGNGDYGGCGQSGEVLKYDDATNIWSVTFNGVTHTYETPTLNTSPGANNNIYHRQFASHKVDVYKLSNQTLTTDFTNVPAGSSNCCNAMEYFPDRNSLITIDSDNGVFEYSFATSTWSGCLINTLSSCGAPRSAQICSAHTTAAPWARYDIVNHRLLFGGCTTAWALSSTLAITQLSSPPFSISSVDSGSPITYDPGTGKLISWDSSGNTHTFGGTSWVNVGSSPFSNPISGGLVCSAVSTYNVVMCFYVGKESIPINSAKIYLYKAQ
jgi:Big-like domain-containing protein/fibronectin type III domain protein